MGITYGFKVNKLVKDKNATACFTAREIVFSVVNLMEAKSSLTREEYYLISLIFEKYSQDKEKRILTQKEFIDLSNEIIGHFDLVAPYYKFGGIRNQSVLMYMKFVDNRKSEYRHEAMRILNNSGLFSKEWIKLHKEFVTRFAPYVIMWSSMNPKTQED